MGEKLAISKPGNSTECLLVYFFSASVGVAKLGHRVFGRPPRIPLEDRPEDLDKLIVLVVGRLRRVGNVVVERRVDGVIRATLQRGSQLLEGFGDAGEVVVVVADLLSSAATLVRMVTQYLEPRRQ